MIGIARKVRKGHFHQKVRVVSNDELGILGDGMNAMTDGLIERDRLRRGLYLAQEIQQALLPQKCPNIDGLDIAARSLYCDETGGDYFDFIGNDTKQLNVVIGDVSGHGISSAILMASVRAFLRQRAHLPGNLSRILSDVNRQLITDVEDSGNFMTLFYLRLDPVKRCLSWIRAGHDPAIFYHPFSDRFDDMHGKGTALGITKQAVFEENQKTGLTAGQIIVLATDGVWEARNKEGNMFGKEPLYHIVRQNRNAVAEDILDKCFQSLEEFQIDAVREDDITMVVIKIVDLN
jgi:sigma-B regulation protein RsbU (phosphoserine phosphatase)